jgi:hypothetical protein
LFATKSQAMRNPNIPSWLEGRWNSEQDAGWEARSKTLELGGKRAELLAAMRSTDRSPQTKIHNNTTPTDQQAGRICARCLFSHTNLSRVSPRLQLLQRALLRCESPIRTHAKPEFPSQRISHQSGRPLCLPSDPNCSGVSR